MGLEYNFGVARRAREADLPMAYEPRPPQIELRGVRVHNLQNVDLDIPLGKLIVVTGVSGSGKSSLAFDTLYAEGQRRYVESFSTYSRRFLERFEKPDTDRIEPIPPAVAVRQKSGGRSRRATVGTATEIYDHLRLLYARFGTIVCTKCGRLVERHTPATARPVLNSLTAGTRFLLCFALAGSSLEGAEESPAGVAALAAAGFTRLILGERTMAVAEAAPRRSPSDGALVVVDRLTAGGTTTDRLADSLELAFRHGNGACVALVQASETAQSPATERRVVDGIEYTVVSFSTRLVCPGCRREFADPEPALFNFNSPLGACPACKGTGEVIAGPVTEPQWQVCATCRGTRLRPEAVAVRVGGKTIVELARMTADELFDFLRATDKQETDADRHLSDQIFAQAVGRLEYLNEVGLGYLTLDRPARTLSGGEAQRVRLTSAFGSKFVNLLYVLDEPTCGLHPRDTERLLTAIRRLRDAGNTLVIVEHDAALIREADLVVDIGPGAGREGGRVVFQGSPAELAGQSQTATADFLSGRRRVAPSNAAARRSPTGWLHLAGVEHHNLHDVSVAFPLGVLCVVTGVSGSGKSSLVEETLYPAVVAGLNGRAAPSPVVAAPDKANPQSTMPCAAEREAGRFSSLTGLDLVDAVLKIDQSPIGRSARANPASFLSLLGEIRTLFATTAEAKLRNFTARHFSFNSAGGGRCETCRGAGSIAIDMQFLPDVVTTCPDCHGARFRREVLEARYRGLSIAEVLALTVRDAFGFFRGRTRLQRRLKVLKDVGLDYLTLGQPANTLSGGESQRLKLASFLSRASRSRTLFVVEEPTIGLHPADIVRLIDCLGQLLAGGHSVVVIEHNVDFLRNADYVIDIGPGAGVAGGRIVATGTPEEISRIPESITGEFLAK